MRDPNTTVLAFFSLVVGAAALILISHLPRPQRLTPAQVATGADQLAELARRTRLRTPDARALTHVTYTFAGPCGTYQAMAARLAWTRHGESAGAETVLWLSLDPHASRLLRNPRRRPLPALTLARNDPNSDLVAPGSPRRLHLAFLLNPPPAPGSEERRLTLSNVRGRGGAATAMNRSLADVTLPAHCDLTPRDVRMLTYLARILRARVCDDLDAVVPTCYPTSLTLFRREKPGDFGIHLRRAGAGSGLAAFTLSVRFHGEDEPETGEVAPLPGASDLGLPAALLFLRPRPPGRAPLLRDPDTVEVRALPGAEAAAPRAVDFQALLGRTTWLGR